MIDPFGLAENLADRIIIKDQVLEPHLSSGEIIGTVNAVNDPV